ncbi:MAG: hypothetical protein IKL13_00915 [Clostridia bacterium]|nr:hypothetical protein [Clostridia bacterium]
MIWHSHTVADVLADLRVDPNVGLTEQEAATRLKEYGNNSLQDHKPHTFRRAFSARLRSPLTVLVLAVSAMVLILDLYKQLLQEIHTHWYLPIFVAIMAVAAALLAALRQCRAASSDDWVYTLTATDTCVRRDGTEQPRNAHTLVPGDIVLLGAGDILPADCRLIEADRLRCDEYTLTGATMPTEKYAEAVFDDITPLAQRTNMLYAGTVITAGTAIAVVVATGVRSEMGHESRNQPQKQDHLPVQNTAQRLNGWWHAVVVVLSIAALIIGLTRVSDRSAVILMAATLAAAAVPTGIAALNAHLIVGCIQRLLRHRVRIHKPEVMDTLGRVTVIGIQQDMLHRDGDITLCRAFVGHRAVDLTSDCPKAPGLSQLLRLAALNTTDTDPSDDALLARLHELGIEKNELLVDMPRIGELSLTVDRKATVHLAGEQTLILVSGAWRSLLPLCAKGNAEELTAAAMAMEQEGLQVTAVTYRLDDVAPSVYTAEVLEHDLTCAGLLGLHIPLCSDAPQANVGVRTILFSDESAAIAAATAQSVGLTDTPYVATAEALLNLNDEQLATVVEQYNVYCGLDTAQKRRILTALQEQGEVVAITACHSEEAELLTAADVGCARGVVATDVVKTAADLILMEDSHAAILAALQVGRRLRWEKTVLLFCLLLFGGSILFVGFGSLFGLCSLTYCSLWLMGMHLLLLALPTPLWITLGISDILYKLRKNR